MDRGIPTEEVLAEMRASPTPIHYLVGTPRGRLTKLEKALAAKPWEDVRESVRVKLIEDGEETYVLARSEARREKEQAMRRRRLRKLIKRLRELQGQELTRDELLLKLGAAKKEAGKAYGLLTIHTPAKDQPVTPQTFHFSLDRKKLRAARRREGGYLLRSNIRGDDPGHLWRLYLQLVEIEQAFKELKNDLSVRPIHHQLETRIEAHIFVAFLAYCLMVTLKQRLKALAPGLTPRAVLEKLAAIQMIDVELPTTDDRTIVLSRHTEPENDHRLLLQRLKLELPAQPPPKITAATPARPPERSPPVVPTFGLAPQRFQRASPRRYPPVGEVGLGMDLPIPSRRRFSRAPTRSATARMSAPCAGAMMSGVAVIDLPPLLGQTVVEVGSCRRRGRVDRRCLELALARRLTKSQDVICEVNENFQRGDNTNDDAVGRPEFERRGDPSLWHGADAFDDEHVRVHARNAICEGRRVDFARDGRRILCGEGSPQKRDDARTAGIARADAGHERLCGNATIRFVLRASSSAMIQVRPPWSSQAVHQFAIEIGNGRPALRNPDGDPN